MNDATYTAQLCKVAALMERMSPDDRARTVRMVGRFYELCGNDPDRIGGEVEEVFHAADPVHLRIASAHRGREIRKNRSRHGELVSA